QRYADSGEINTTVHDPLASVERVAATLTSRGVAIDRLDGLTADFGPWWFNLRASNTEPLLRLNVEAATRDELKAGVDEALALIKESD
ncbi:MAG: phosphomannomutase/phosphoglucomutase, partial [Acidobacteriota bacterium]|nr:phosphomannomutase/phosphoglucomutase [Acidobacteriota bacterium]